MSRIVREPSRFTRQSSTNKEIVKEKVVEAKSPVVNRSSRVSRRIESAKVETSINPRKRTNSLDNKSQLLRLPADTGREILRNMSCIDLMKIKLTDPILGSFITPNLIREAKNYNYPRKENHTKVFELTEYFDPFTIKDYKQLSDFIQFETKLTVKNQVFLLSYFPQTKFTDFNNAVKTVTQELRRLIKTNIKHNQLPNNLVKGDIVTVRNQMYFIYDGCKLINFDTDNKFIFSDDFQVVKDNVSINYWFKNYYKQLDGLDVNITPNKNYLVNFNHQPYREQLIDNFQVINDHFTTNFEANNKIYRIIFKQRFDKKDLESKRNKYIKLFEQSDYIPFTADGVSENSLIILI